MQARANALDNYLLQAVYQSANYCHIASWSQITALMVLAREKYSSTNSL
jgi:hypothetical protein